MTTRKPDYWPEMSYDEQRAWERQARELDDAEYERDLERQSRESAEAQARKEREARKREAEGHREEYEAQADDLRHTEAELRLRDEWLKLKGLEEEFDDWASYRREE
jgi:hypothetical protein